MARLIGTVDSFNSAKGFGFLAHDGGNNVFFDCRAIEDLHCKSLKQGQVVEFEIIQGGRGKQQAANVVLVFEGE